MPLNYWAQIIREFKMPKPIICTETVPYGPMNDDEIEVTYRFIPGIPARTYGPPEDCYPGEAAEYDIQSVTLDGKEIELTNDEQEEVINWLIENGNDDQRDDDGDYRYEQYRDRLDDD